MRTGEGGYRGGWWFGGGGAAGRTENTTREIKRWTAGTTLRTVYVRQQREPLRKASQTASTIAGLPGQQGVWYAPPHSSDAEKTLAQYLWCCAQTFSAVYPETRATARSERKCSVRTGGRRACLNPSCADQAISFSPGSANQPRRRHRCGYFPSHTSRRRRWFPRSCLPAGEHSPRAVGVSEGHSHKIHETLSLLARGEGVHAAIGWQQDKLRAAWVPACLPACPYASSPGLSRLDSW